MGTEGLQKCGKFEALGWLVRSNQKDMEIWAGLGRSQGVSFGAGGVELSRITEGLEGKGFDTE